MSDELWEDITFDGRRHVSIASLNPEIEAKAVAPMMLDDTLDWWRRGMMEHLHRIRALCEERMEGIPGVTFPRLEGTYVPFPRFDYGMTSQELRDYLYKEARIGLSVGTGFGSKGEGHLRLCIATSEVIMSEALDRMETALTKL